MAKNFSNESNALPREGSSTAESAEHSREDNQGPLKILHCDKYDTGIRNFPLFSPDSSMIAELFSVIHGEEYLTPVLCVHFYHLNSLSWQGRKLYTDISLESIQWDHTIMDIEIETENSNNNGRNDEYYHENNEIKDDVKVLHTLYAAGRFRGEHLSNNRKLVCDPKKRETEIFDSHPQPLHGHTNN